MYTRRYPTPTRRPITPPPDYSGTAISRPHREPSAEPPFTPPPPALPETNITAAETADTKQNADHNARPTVTVAAPTPQRQPEEDPRLRGGASRRPDLDSPPATQKRRFTLRSPRRGKIGLALPGNQTKRPLGLREGEEGYRPGRRQVISAFSSIGQQEWALDDLLLLGLIFLLLNGSEDAVREHLDVIVLLGFLFFVGMLGNQKPLQGSVSPQ